MHIDTIWPDLLKKAIASHKADAQQDSIRETIGAHVVLDGSMEQFLLNPRRRLNPIYASAELLWYLSRTKSAEMICAYAPAYAKFCEDGEAYGAYGARIARNLAWKSPTQNWSSDEDQLEVVIGMLKKRSTSKKCVVSLWRPSDLHCTREGWHKDIPCTIAWQFIARGERLNMLCYMRSNDLWKGFLYDVYVNTVIQRYVAAAIGLTAGEYHHIAGSEHLYEKDVKKAEEAIECWNDVPPSHRRRWLAPVPDWVEEPYHPSSNFWTEDDLKITLECEHAIRNNEYVAMSGGFLPYVLRDAILCCSQKFGQLASVDQIRSPGLRQAMENFLCPKP